MDKLAEKLGISKDNNNMYVLPQNEDIQKKWFDELTKWYADRAQRRYKAEYYILRNKMLSMKTRDAEREIQSMIDSITQSMTINGVQYETYLQKQNINSQNLYVNRKDYYLTYLIQMVAKRLEQIE